MLKTGTLEVSPEEAEALKAGKTPDRIKRDWGLEAPEVSRMLEQGEALIKTDKEENTHD